uniref:Uncharacterized protein n=1 Tax=Acrobeloides nanus TaxID=290746 RepID=A0A914E811_9BILA
MTSKNKTEIKPWQYAVERIRGRVIQEKENKQQLKEARKQFEDYLFRGFRHENENIDVDEMMEHPKQLKQLLEIKRQTDPKTDRDQKLLDLLRDGVKLGYSLVGRNTSELEDKNLKAFSPRLLSVVPEEDDKNSVDLLSPSLFSLHSKGKGIEKLSSLPNLVQGFSQGDQQEWLNFIIEAAGVNEQIDNLEQDPRLASNNPNWRQPMDNKIIGKRYKADIYNKNGQPHYVTKENATKILGSLQERKVNTWEKLVKTYSKEQLSELNATGYTTLTKEQLYIVYGPSSPFNNSETLHRLSKANSSEIQDLIERDIHHISKQRSFNIRQKDVKQPLAEALAKALEQALAEALAEVLTEALEKALAETLEEALVEAISVTSGFCNEWSYSFRTVLCSVRKGCGASVSRVLL